MIFNARAAKYSLLCNYWAASSMSSITWNLSKKYNYWPLSLSETDFEATEKQFRERHRITEAMNADRQNPKLTNTLYIYTCTLVWQDSIEMP